VEITNIVLEKDRFKVFATINGVEKVNLFKPEVTAKEIIDWVQTEAQYYEDLKAKEIELKSLIGEVKVAKIEELAKELKVDIKDI
jgi:hypothetical protein